jgi:hypothetical protein
MILRSVFGATVVALAFSSLAADPAYAQRRDGALLPQEQDGDVTAVGCLVRGTAVRGGKDDYVLARPKRGPIASVPEASCTADAGADALQLDNAEKGPITPAMVGKWVQISGRLEKETSKDPDDLREPTRRRLLPLRRLLSSRLRHRRRCRRRRARFQRLDWPGCFCCRQVWLFVRSVCVGRTEAADTSGRGRDSWMPWRTSSSAATLCRRGRPSCAPSTS